MIAILQHRLPVGGFGGGLLAGYSLSHISKTVLSIVKIAHFVCPKQT